MKQWSGFTMIEMSVVLTIVAIITGMTLYSGMDALESTRRVATETKMDQIEAALMAFRERYGRLPCPADAALVKTNANFGLEAANAGSCTGGTPAATYMTLGAPLNVPSGTVPVRTLNLPDEFMLDGWGKKMHYEVTPAMTAEHAFNYSQFSDDCSITAKDESDTALVMKPIYALVSYGKNGQGAYLLSGSQYTDGTAGTAEATNIRTTTNTPTVRMMTGVRGAMGTAGYYDDLVRTKARYQMLGAGDRLQTPYKGPEMALGYNASAGTQFVYGKRKCGEYQGFSGTVPSAVAAVPKFAAFTPSNTNFFVYHTAICKLYKVVGTEVSAVDDVAPVPNCPAAATAGAMAQANGMLALNSTSSPYLRVWKLVGSGAAAHYIELPNALMPVLASAPEHISFSENGDILTVSKTSTYKNIYVRSGDTYTALRTTKQPDNASTVYGNAISPSGRYYASAVVSGGNTNLTIYRNINGTYTSLGAAVTLTGLTNPDIITFSPDSKYVAVGGTSTSSELHVVYINPTLETLTAVTSLDLSPTPTAADFSSDSRFLAVARASTDTNSVAFYRRTNASFSTTADTLSSNFTFNNSDNSSIIALSR